MPRTIDLHNRLEALYYFDSTYFDTGSNELSDHSGHERHASASGGPSVGVDGPGGFEAVSLDQTDDTFDISSTPAFGDEATIAFLAKVSSFDPSKDRRMAMVSKDSNDIIDFQEQSTADKFAFAVSGDVVEVDNLSQRSYTDIWSTYVCRRSETEDYQDILINGDRISAINGLSDGTVDFDYIGSKDGTTQYVDAQIAYVGIWSRAISHAEAIQLTHLSGPRRAIA